MADAASRFCCLLACCALFMAVLPILGRAQALPGSQQDAREIQRQQARERVLRERMEERPDVRLERGADGFAYLPDDEKPCFVIHEIALEGDGADKFDFALSAASPAKDPVYGRCLGTQGINMVMKRVQNRIIEKGFVTTRVLAAPQDLSAGKLSLTVVLGRVRKVMFGGGTPGRATRWNAMPLKEGDVLNLRDIEQALENFKRVPTAEADFRIVPAEGEGAQPGESDIIIFWNQSKPVRFNVSVDDSGSKYTGKYQGNATLSLDHAFLLNDLLYASLGHDLGGGTGKGKGSESYTLHYEVPYHYWLFSFTAGKYDYHQTIPGIHESYIYSGSSRHQELKLSRLFYRDAAHKSTAWISGWHRASSNAINDVNIELQERDMAGWEAGLNHKAFIGASTIDAAISYKRGTGLLDSMKAPEEAWGEGTSRPKIVMADLFVNVPFTLFAQHFSYSGQFRRQWNHTPLVPQDRFSIGGRYTVRGFDGEMTLMGDRGWLARNELGVALGNTGGQLYAAWDYGEVGGQSTRYLKARHLSGAAMGIRGSYDGFYWDFFASVPLSRPEGFETMDVAAGFTIGWSY